MLGRVTTGPAPDIQPVVDAEYIMNAREVVRQVYVDEKIMDYALKLVVATRDPSLAGLDDLEDLIDYGASPRVGESFS